jgi:hypothetical protein
MEMKYVVAMIITLVIILVSMFIIIKNNGVSGGLFDGLRSIFGL